MTSPLDKIFRFIDRTIETGKKRESLVSRPGDDRCKAQMWVPACLSRVVGGGKQEWVAVRLSRIVVGWGSSTKTNGCEHRLFSLDLRSSRKQKCMLSGKTTCKI